MDDTRGELRATECDETPRLKKELKDARTTISAKTQEIDVLKHQNEALRKVVQTARAMAEAEANLAKNELNALKLKASQDKQHHAEYCRTQQARVTELIRENEMCQEQLSNLMWERDDLVEREWNLRRSLSDL